jgi:ribulose-5-phosphate 4-epimerase/fuculose-1-phosphate aldolase
MPDSELTLRLIDAIQVLTKENVQTGSGHLSARLPGGDSFLINPRYAGALAEPEDICTVNLDGKRLAGEGPLPIETVIHSVIYKRRPDVGAVFHSHPRYGILLGLLDVGFIPFKREAGLFADGVPLFPSSKGIQSVEAAEQLAATLGDHYAVFLKGHGVVVVGPNVEATAVAAIQFENACFDQLFMMQFGKPQPLVDMSHGLSGPRMENPYRAWPFLLHKHGIHSKEEIRAMAKAGSRKTVREGEE